MIELLAAAAALGFGGSVHCAGMCGPIALAVGATSWRLQAAYHLSRLLGYTSIGVLLGIAGSRLGLFGGGWVQVWVSWGLAGLLILAAFWPALPLNLPGPIARLGRNLQGRAMRMEATPRVIGMGFLTTLLPCGLLYAAYLLAVGGDGALGGGAAMLVFGATSAPGVLIGQRGFVWLSARMGRRGQSILRGAVIVAAALLLIRRGYMQYLGGPACH